ncbi:MAG: DUF6588 family protein [Saprospiraceae bacterium]
MKKLILICVSCMLFTHIATSQRSTIKDYLDSYIGQNADPYVQPLADLFSSNINTDVWEWSNFDQKFFIRFKLQAMVSFPSESMRTFQGTTTGDFHPQQTVTAPTIIGDPNEIFLQGADTTFYVFPGGYNLKRMPLGTPQLTVGGFLNTEISARFLSFPLGQDLGRVRFVGIGARHSLTGYFDNPPFDLSIGYFYHHIQASTYLHSDQQLVSASLGKSGTIFSGQFTVGYQTSNSHIHYDFDNGDNTTYPVNLYLHNNNNWLIEANAGLRLGPVFASAGISYTNHVTIVAGAGLFL